MTGSMKAGIYGFFVVAVFFCLSLTAVAHEKGLPEGAVKCNASEQHSDGPALHRWAEQGTKNTRHQGNHLMRHALKQLDLTAAQKAAIHDIKVAQKKDKIQRRADLKIASMELHEYLRKENVDMGAVESQIKKIEGLKTAMMLNTIKTREEIKSKMTQEQRKKFTELMRDGYQGRVPEHREG